MSFCCEDAIAEGIERKNIDEKGMIVRVTIPGSKEEHYYYRSEKWVHNLVNSLIPEYVGPVAEAPQEFYGNGRWEVDKELTELIN